MTNPTKELPIPGEVFGVEGCTAFLIMPERVAAGKQNAMGMVRSDASRVAGSGREMDV